MTTLNAGKPSMPPSISQEIRDTYYAYYSYPHLAMVPDYFIRYWDLAAAVCEHFGVPFEKPTLCSPKEAAELNKPLQ